MIYKQSFRAWSIPLMSADCRMFGIELHVSIIIPWVQLTHVTAFISHLRNVIEIFFVCLVNLSHSSEVSQLQASPIFAKPVLEHSSLSPSQCSTKGFTMCCGSETDKGYDKHLLSKAACETISVETKQGTRADKAQFIWVRVSFLRLPPMPDYDACFVNL